MKEHRSPIPARIYNAAVSGHICGPDDIDFGQKVVHLIKYDKDGNEVSFESQVTQANKIYVIHDDFVLSSNVTIPTNCVLEFDGGSISASSSNNEITGQNTYIIGNLLNILSNSISLVGDWKFKSISPDWFIGTDIQKVQKAIDVAITNKSVQVDINRTYNLTGGTVYIERGIHSEDEISPYSRRDFIISGSGEGRFIKEDAGFMFSARSASIDIEFSKIHFRGYLTDPSDLSTIVDMKVFDCRYLYNIRVSNCTFCHCGCVYHQTGDTSVPMTGTLSLNNQYTKNKYVLQANECWHSQFVCDTIEDGLSAVEMEDENSNLRDFKIINCCIEGFYLTDTIALNFKGNLSSCSITDNYFEANYCSMRAVHALTGIITGNSFHSRGRVDATKEVHCIELANCANNLVVTGNNVVVNDANMYMFWFDTTSPYYVQSQLLIGENAAAKNTNISNVQDKIVILSSFIRDNNVKYANDIINIVKQSFPQITDGHVYLSRAGKQVTISVSVTTNAAITSGSVNNYQDTCKPINNGGYDQILIDKNTGNVGDIIINTSGTLYIKVPNAGTYFGVLSYIHL